LEGQESISRLQKYSTASWPGLDNFQEYLTQDGEGNLTIRSTDEEDVASITISNTGFQLKATFLYLLPFKKPQWIEINDANKSHISVTSGASQSTMRNQTSKRMKMAYEYA
jgi:hypothetical protein